MTPGKRKTGTNVSIALKMCNNSRTLWITRVGRSHHTTLLRDLNPSIPVLLGQRSRNTHRLRDLSPTTSQIPVTRSRNTHPLRDLSPSILSLLGLRSRTDSGPSRHRGGEVAGDGALTGALGQVEADRDEDEHRGARGPQGLRTPSGDDRAGRVAEVDRPRL